MVALEPVNGGEPAHRHAFTERLLELLAVSRHVFLVAAIDNDGVRRAETARGARRVERGVTTAVDDDPTTEHRCVVGGDLVEKRDGVDHAGRITRGDRHASTQLGTDRQEDGIEATFVALSFDVTHVVIELDLNAHRDDAGDLGVEYVTWESVGGDTVAHHAAELGR